MTKTPFVVATLLCASVFSASADDSSDRRGQQIFRNFDTNGDGGISLEEYKAGMIGNMSPSRIESVFREKDGNNDGKLSIEELFYVPADQRLLAPVKKSGQKTGKDGKKAKTQ